MNKLSSDGTIDQLLLRPIVSNIGTPSYFLSKHLAKILSPLDQSEYTVKNTEELTREFKNFKPVTENSKVVSFDLWSLFTSVPLEYTIEIIMRRIYIEHELDLTRVRIRTRVRTNITSELELSTLNFFDKNVSFTYETEQTGNISFLYVPIMRKNNGPIEFTIHQKLAHNDVYFHWESFVPDA